MKKLFLFDMDGTLTPPRGKMNHDMLSKLTQLQKNFWDIGVISGSDMDYIDQQCNIMFDLSPINPRTVHFLPCNGTKYYKNFKKVWEYSMTEALGREDMHILMKTLISLQHTIVSVYKDIPLTGNFIQMRGSVLNWCPIGRNASLEQREVWAKLDKEHYIREHFLNEIKNKINSKKITVKLGGETSFDIYPKGWNKTFPLTFSPFNEYEKVYFAGDRCYTNGNDEELYNFLNNKENCKGFQVSNVTDTIKVIEESIQES